MSLLTIVQAAALELGLSSPSSVYSNSDSLVQQLLSHANREGTELRTKFEWPQLVKEHTFTLTNGQAAYPMPADFQRFVFMTHWDRTQQWELYGPVSSEDWQYIKSGTSTSGPRRRWRFKGYATNQFFIDPTPGSGDDGATMVFEYYSKNWCKPRTWAAGQVYGTNSYTFYNGNYYSTTAGGTAGATPPTHTSSTDSDGGITWAYVSTPYEAFTADTDESHLDESLISLGVKWRFLDAKGLPGFETARMEYEAAIKRGASNLMGAGPINLNAGRWARGLPYPRTPETGYG